MRIYYLIELQNDNTDTENTYILELPVTKNSRFSLHKYCQHMHIGISEAVPGCWPTKYPWIHALGYPCHVLPPQNPVSAATR